MVLVALVVATLALSSRVMAAAASRTPGGPCAPWPAWQAFQQRFISADGRVVDTATDRAHTTSEGQAYALFFALVANDRGTFARLLRWTRDNLAQGDLAARLPAWQWGRRDDGSWAVVDANSASDADLWLAYALAEAGRLWHDPVYRRLSHALADRVLKEEVTEVPGLGLVLLPGREGFGPWPADQRVRVRLNPSYLPLPVLRRLGTLYPQDGWDRVLQSSAQVITGAAPAGWAPDWTTVESGDGQTTWLAGETPDLRTGAYDAIRVYLWLGLTSPLDAALQPLLEHHAPLLRHVEQTGQVPLRTDVVTGATEGVAGGGMTAAVLPFLLQNGRQDLVQRLMDAGVRQSSSTGHYYDQALGLFAFGALDRRYRFGADGALIPGWTACKEATPSSR